MWGKPRKLEPFYIEIRPERGGAEKKKYPTSDNLFNEPIDAEAFIEISWQDNRSGVWSKKRRINLGILGDTAPIKELQALGTYLTRQWEIEWSSRRKLSLVTLFEDTEVLK